MNKIFSIIAILACTAILLVSLSSCSSTSDYDAKLVSCVLQMEVFLDDSQTSSPSDFNLEVRRTKNLSNMLLDRSIPSSRKDHIDDYKELYVVCCRYMDEPNYSNRKLLRKAIQTYKIQHPELIDSAMKCKDYSFGPSTIRNWKF